MQAGPSPRLGPAAAARASLSHWQPPHLKSSVQLEVACHWPRPASFSGSGSPKADKPEPELGGPQADSDKPQA